MSGNAKDRDYARGDKIGRNGSWPQDIIRDIGRDKKSPSYKGEIHGRKERVKNGVPTRK